jgi:hypothetical protein
VSNLKIFFPRASYSIPDGRETWRSFEGTEENGFRAVEESIDAVLADHAHARVFPDFPSFLLRPVQDQLPGCRECVGLARRNNPLGIVHDQGGVADVRRDTGYTACQGLGDYIREPFAGGR